MTGSTMRRRFKTIIYCLEMLCDQRREKENHVSTSLRWIRGNKERTIKWNTEFGTGPLFFRSIIIINATEAHYSSCLLNRDIVRHNLWGLFILSAFPDLVASFSCSCIPLDGLHGEKRNCSVYTCINSCALIGQILCCVKREVEDEKYGQGRT